jgi:hypothetical protein
MKKFNYLPILILITINLLVFGGCEKHSDPKEVYKYYYLTPSQVAQSPYFTSKKYDTLSFFNTLGDTFTFAKIKTDTAFVKESSTEFGSEVTTYYNYQYLHNTYQTLKGNGKFEVWHYYSSPRGATRWIQIKLLDRSIEYGDDFINGDYENFTYYDSLELRGKNFINAVKFYWYDDILKDFSQWNYANAEDGIFATIQSSTYDTLFLIKK